MSEKQIWIMVSMVCAGNMCALLSGVRDGRVINECLGGVTANSMPIRQHRNAFHHDGDPDPD